MYYTPNIPFVSKMGRVFNLCAEKSHRRAVLPDRSSMVLNIQGKISYNRLHFKLKVELFFRM